MMPGLSWVLLQEASGQPLAKPAAQHMQPHRDRARRRPGLPSKSGQRLRGVREDE